MGTVVEITLVGDDEEATGKAALQAFQEIKRIETLMSPWIKSSDVTRMNRSAGKEWVKVSPETLKVIKKAKEISELSGGGLPHRGQRWENYPLPRLKRQNLSYSFQVKFQRS